MKRGIAVLGMGCAFAAAQLLQPQLPNKPSDQSHDLLHDPKLDPQVRSILKRSCADCHSNQPHLPWYGRVSPVSWFIARHMERGRHRLNFSDWPRHPEDEKQDIADSVDKQDMPIASYLWMHRDARLSSADRRTIDRWADSQ